MNDPFLRPTEPFPTPSPQGNELRDFQWESVAALLPADPVKGRRRTTDLRRVVAAIQFQWRTGCPWRKLPPEYQPWTTYYGYFRTWSLDGTLRKIRPHLDSRRSADSRVKADGRNASSTTKLNPHRDATAHRGEWRAC